VEIKRPNHREEKGKDGKDNTACPESRMENALNKKEESQTAPERLGICGCKGEDNDTGLYVTILLPGDVKANFLIDTGSSATLLSAATFSKLKETDRPRTCTPAAPLTAVNGQSVQQYGVAHMEIEIGGV
jgi:hypothetical protein